MRLRPGHRARLARLKPTPATTLPALSWPAKAYLAAVVALSLALAAVAIVVLDFSRPRHAYLLIIFGVLLAVDQLGQPMRASRRSAMRMRFDSAFLVVLALLFPTGWAFTTMLAAIALGELPSRRGRVRKTFNIAQAGIFCSLAFLVMQGLGISTAASPRNVGIAILGAAVAHISSYFLVVNMVSLAQGERPRYVAPGVFYLALAASVVIGVLTAIVTLDHLWALPFALVAAFAAYLSLESRLATHWDKEQAQTLIDLAQRVYRVDQPEEVERVVLASGERILQTSLRLSSSPPQAGELGSRLLDDERYLILDHPASGQATEDQSLLDVLAAFLSSARRGVWARAQESEQERGRLLAAVAHELRTPLTSIIGFTQTLRSGRLADPAPALEQIALAGVSMERLITDLLTLQQAREERFRVEREPVELRPLLEEQLTRYRGQSESHRLELSVSAEPVVLADPLRLQQVVANLLSNAIKYSPAGGAVEVGLDRRDGQARVEVRDHGLGVPAALRERLFTRFFRIPGEERAAIRGSGLGLALVRELVEAQGGEVGYLEPQDGQGSLFYFELPLAEDAAVAETVEPAVGSSSTVVGD